MICVMIVGAMRKIIMIKWIKHHYRRIVWLNSYGIIVGAMRKIIMIKWIKTSLPTNSVVENESSNL